MTHRLSFWLSFAATVVALAASAVVYVNREQWLPAQVPTHWNAANVVDAYTPRDHLLPLLLLMPGMMAGFTLLALVLPWLSPRPFSVDTFRGTYNYIMLLAVLMMGWIHASVLVGFIWPTPEVFIRMLLGGVFLFLALMGNVMGKVRRNFWVGVRTPWTLASDTVWNQTHRLAAWTLTAAGLAGCVAAVIHPLFGGLVGAALLVAAGLVPVVYSAVLYRRLEKARRV
ncbi:MAG TPA: SdpI family protein [Gemmataceae bacterium]|nr:SdpI family protein [Gemmataceae bacterium]